MPKIHSTEGLDELCFVGGAVCFFLCSSWLWERGKGRRSSRGVGGIVFFKKRGGGSRTLGGGHRVQIFCVRGPKFLPSLNSATVDVLVLSLTCLMTVAREMEDGQLILEA